MNVLDQLPEKVQASSKRFKKTENATAMIWRLLLVAEKRFRKVDASHLAAEVSRTGAKLQRPEPPMDPRRYVMRRVSIWLICLGAFAAIPFAVPEAAPAPGTRIRLLVPPALIKPTPGTLLDLTEDSLTFRPDGASRELHLPLSAVANFEMSRGKHRNAGTGAKIGLVVGAVLGVGYALAYDEAKAGFLDPSPGGGIVLGAVGGLLDGALIGALIQTEKWESVDPATLPPRVGALGVPEDRLALRMRLARF